MGSVFVPYGTQGPAGGSPAAPWARAMVGKFSFGILIEKACGSAWSFPPRSDFSYRIVSGVLVIAKIPGKGRVLTYRVG